MLSEEEEIRLRCLSGARLVPFHALHTKVSEDSGGLWDPEPLPQLDPLAPEADSGFESSWTLKLRENSGSLEKWSRARDSKCPTRLRKPRRNPRAVMCNTGSSFRLRNI